MPDNQPRQVVLDTETTGLSTAHGHRIIEIGAVEIINRRLTDNTYHVYINPQRPIDDEAVKVHGITNEFLADKPLFADIAAEYLAFTKDAELIIHNAPFDLGFLDNEMALLGKTTPIKEQNPVVDTLVEARKMHPGARASLDALCKRYFIDTSRRSLHGALLDAELLAEVYLQMSGGQSELLDNTATATQTQEIPRLSPDRAPLKIITCSEDDLSAHRQQMQLIKESSGTCLWEQLQDRPVS